LTLESERRAQELVVTGPTSRGVAAVYFDGRHSTPHAVTLTVESATLIVEGVTANRTASLDELDISEALGTSPRLIRFRDGAFCEVDAAALQMLLGRKGTASPPITRWEGSVRWVVAAALLFVATLIAAYRYAVPAIAVVVADQVPASIVDVISRQVMAALDTQMFEPTIVSSDRQARLLERFHRVRFPAADPSVSFEITFRKSDVLGPNAMALPSGTIVVTDALLALAHSDEDLIAVLAHEAGHVARRHGLRQLVQNSLVALAVTWLIGDVSAIAAAAPTALLQAKYSRDLEREADSYALVTLRVNGIPTEHFAAMLERLEHAADERGGTAAGALDYLSSHPVTTERIERVRQTH
jgi:Zn-dependent protease with chaperone function